MKLEVWWVLLDYSGTKGSSFEPGFPRIFVNIFLLVPRMALIFFYWREELGCVDLLNTLNVVVKCVEKFLQAFEKKSFNPKKGVRPGSLSLF